MDWANLSLALSDENLLNLSYDYFLSFLRIIYTLLLSHPDPAV